jgi:hypothetical protein
MVWPQLLIETKKQELLQICTHECDGPSRPFSCDLKNCSKNYDCFNTLSINKIKDQTILIAPRN